MRPVLERAAYGPTTLIKIYLQISVDICDFLNTVHQHFSDNFNNMTSFAVSDALLPLDIDPPFIDLYPLNDGSINSIATSTVMPPVTTTSNTGMASFISTPPVTATQTSTQSVLRPATQPTQSVSSVQHVTHGSCNVCTAMESTSSYGLLYGNLVLLDPSRLKQPKDFKYSAFQYFINHHCNSLVTMDIMYSCARCKGTITLQSSQYSVSYLASITKTFLLTHKLS